MKRPIRCSSDLATVCGRNSFMRVHTSISSRHHSSIWPPHDVCARAGSRMTLFCTFVVQNSSRVDPMESRFLLAWWKNECVASALVSFEVDTDWIRWSSVKAFTYRCKTRFSQRLASDRILIRLAARGRDPLARQLSSRCVVPFSTCFSDDDGFV